MTKMLFRNAHKDDLAAIGHLASGSGVVGITTLPKDTALLKKRLAKSSDSFEANITSPSNEYYLFVLEETESGKIVGTSAIEASIGYDTPFYSYKISKRTRICHELNIRNNYEVMNVVNDNQGNSEICTLYLDPEYRRKHNGLLLSRARFLFMAQYPQRFAANVIAEMRGISDQEGNSPFWDQVGSYFFQMSFAEADRLTTSTNKQFIADLMPRNLIYVSLLSPATQAVIGQPHESTKPAMEILLREGFRYNHYVDIFDAGPIIEAPSADIKTAAESKVMTLKSCIDEVSSKPFIIANTQLEFRATVSQALIHEEDASCMLDHATAEILEVKCGDSVRVTPM